jgi:hypothetical protein
MGFTAGNVGGATMSVSVRALDRSALAAASAPGEEWCRCHEDEIRF